MTLNPLHAMTRFHSRNPLIASLLALASPLVMAQAFDAVRLYGVPVGDGAGLAGVALIAGHEYLGSDERKLRAYPVLDYQWKNGWFAGTSNGIGYQFATPENYQVGLRVTADLGRRESASDALAGVGNIDVAAEIGGFANFFITPEWFLTSSIRYGAGNDHNGVQVDVGAGYSTQLSQRWRGAVGIGGTYVNADYMQTFYGISSAQQMTSGYGTYFPGAGWRDIRGNASLTWFFADAWSATLGLSVRALQTKATGSPLVTEDTPIVGLLVVSYSF
jgi:outer membrane scaffolding protein for murein synthesis (MipA/OmpV family)